MHYCWIIVSRSVIFSYILKGVPLFWGMITMIVWGMPRLCSASLKPAEEKRFPRDASRAYRACRRLKRRRCVPGIPARWRWGGLNTGFFPTESLVMSVNIRMLIYINHYSYLMLSPILWTLVYWIIIVSHFKGSEFSGVHSKAWWKVVSNVHQAVNQSSCIEKWCAWATQKMSRYTLW